MFYTFWRMVHCVLQVFDNTFLPDHFFNFRLCFDIERVRVKQGQFALFLSFILLVLPYHLLIDLAPPRRVMYCVCEVLVLSSDLIQDNWVPKRLQAEHLGIGS